MACFAASALSPLYIHAHTHKLTSAPLLSHRGIHTHTHITPPTVRLQIASQGDSIDLQTVAQETDAGRLTEKVGFQIDSRWVTGF